MENFPGKTQTCYFRRPNTQPFLQKMRKEFEELIIRASGELSVKVFCIKQCNLSTI